MSLNNSAIIRANKCRLNSRILYTLENSNASLELQLLVFSNSAKLTKLNTRSKQKEIQSQ